MELYAPALIKKRSRIWVVDTDKIGRFRFEIFSTETDYIKHFQRTGTAESESEKK